MGIKIIWWMNGRRSHEFGITKDNVVSWVKMFSHYQRFNKELFFRVILERRQAS